jgi:ParB family chromosome partitioning protein
MAAAGRRTSLLTLAGQKVDDVPGKSDPLLLSLPLAKLVPTRFNPRRRFGTDDELRDFGAKLAKEQLQPAVVVSRTAYLKLWPEEAEHVGDAAYVIANGERRYRASRLVGRPVLEVVHKEDVAASRATFLDAVQSENNDRQDLDPIERALAIDIMVRELGGADQVAVYYGKTKGWVSQQRKLLKLTPELQDLVSSGEMPVRVGRDIAGLPAEVQDTAWEEEVAKRQAAREAAARWKTDDAPGRAPAEAPGAGPRFTAVNQNPSPPEPAATPNGQSDRFTAVNRNPTGTAQPPAPAVNAVGQSERFTAVNHSASTPAARAPEQSPASPGGMPAPREAQPPVQEERTLTLFPYNNGPAAAQFLIERMPDDQFAAMMPLLIERWNKVAARS